MCAASSQDAADLATILEEPPQPDLGLSSLRSRRNSSTQCRQTDAGFQPPGCVCRCLKGSQNPEEGNHPHIAPLLRHASAGSRSQLASNPGISGSYFAQDHGRLHASDGDLTTTGTQDYRHADGGSVRQAQLSRYFQNPRTGVPRKVRRSDAAIAHKDDGGH